VDPEPLDPEPKQQSELLHGLVSALNASKKLHLYRMMALAGQAAEEADVFSCVAFLSPLLREMLK
jgi:hypothetical protein